MLFGRGLKKGISKNFLDVVSTYQTNKLYMNTIQISQYIPITTQHKQSRLWT